MRIAIIADTHIGARNGSPQFRDYMETFYKDVFFPYLDEHGIHDVIHLGDLVDRRKYVDFQSLWFINRNILKPLKRRNISFTCLVGNHDTPYKNSNFLNAVDEILYWVKDAGTRIISKPTEMEFGGKKVLLLPWINVGNHETSLKMIAETDATIAMGHLEMAGIEMYKGSPSHEGLSPGLFSKFSMVLSGHFHHRSINKNIIYVGAPYEMIWSDYITDQDPKGFHIWDTETGELTLVPNPNKIFWKIDAETEVTPEMKNAFIRVTNPDNAEKIVQMLGSTNHDVQTVPSNIMENVVFEGDDTISILKNATMEKEKIFVYLKDKYFRALEIQAE